MGWGLGFIFYLTWTQNAFSTTTANPRGVLLKNLATKSPEVICQIHGKIQALKEKGPSIESQVFYELLILDSTCGMVPRSLVQVLIPGAEALSQGGYRFSPDFKTSIENGKIISLKVEHVSGANTLTREAFDHWIIR